MTPTTHPRQPLAWQLNHRQSLCALTGTLLSDLQWPADVCPALFILLIIKTLAMRQVAGEIISPMGFILL